MADIDNVKFDKNFRAGMLAETDDSTRTTSPLKVDPTTKRLKVDSNSGDGAATVNNGTKAVTTPGTAECLVAVSTPCKRVFIQASSANTDIVAVGGSGVVADEATRQGIAIYPAQGMFLNVANLNLIYLDVIVAGEKCNFYFEN